jgi:hypothetical protein
MKNQPPTDPSKRRSRLENEVLEILERTDRETPNVVKFQSRVQRQRLSLRTRLRRYTVHLRLSSQNLLLATFVLAILAVIASNASPLAGRVLAFLSVAALVSLFARSLWKPEQPSVKRWRGRDVDFSSPTRPEWWNRLFGGPKGPKR